MDPTQQTLSQDIPTSAAAVAVTAVGVGGLLGGLFLGGLIGAVVAIASRKPKKG